jgi:hypothetical protein
MKRLLVGTLLLCSLMSASAFANTIISYRPNDGSGDNFGFVVSGPGFLVAGGGGTPVDFFSVFGYAPGSTLGGGSDIFFSEGFAMIGPISYDVFFNGGGLSMSTITLPTNGMDFRAPVTIGFDATGTLDTPLQQSIDVSGSANGYIRFDFSNGTYTPENFVEVPEPGTLGLIGTGLLGVAARGRNKFLRKI